MRAAHYLAYVVGKAHGRQMDPSTAADWRRDVAGGASGKAETPSWLWSSVVKLAGRHEVGYLAHCRRHALADAA